VGFFSRKDERSGVTARNRLRVVLLTDRMNTSDHVLDAMRDEIIAVIRKYLDVNLDELDFHICNPSPENSGDSNPSVVAKIPFTGMRKRAL